ncbi:TetR/AcrR family transcriptional regulator [Nocardiopsis valliformis]|uniref:TetR/AcrR family transcriptional regulator n=1 Tax=Nocardiopsis valliformis TaxID=239974 RepID=UPI00034CBF5B|nr:TetR/AcrR family transcriptional regulator [Nocardiopsis valliformis]
MPTTPEPETGGTADGGAAGGRRTPGPRRRLSRELIVSTAVELIEARGLRALSMRSLAERLEVAPGTLYTYVANRTVLETLILDSVIAQDGLPHELPGTWLEKLAAWARDDWVTFREKPWVIELRQANHDFGPASVTWLDSALRVFDGTGLPAQVKFDMIDSLDAYVLGAATVHTQSVDRVPNPSADMLPEIQQAHLEATRLIEAVGEGGTPFGQSRFEFGLRCLLTGFQTIAEQEQGKEQGSPAEEP